MNAIQKAFYAGLGAAIITRNRLESALDDLVTEGKMAAPDARRFVKKVVRQSRQELTELGDDLDGKLRDIAARSAAAANERLRDLERRLDKIERHTRPTRPRAASARTKRSRPD